MATKLGWHLLDSGLLYRITAFLVTELGININDSQEIKSLYSRRVKLLYSNAGVVASGRDSASKSMHNRDSVEVLNNSLRQSYVRWNGRDITDTMRSDPISKVAFDVAASPKVREELKQIQRERRIEPGLVADGRDMGTVIFPEAELKIFLRASHETRAYRRLGQLKLPDSEFQRIRELMAERDKSDSTRDVAPAIPADDAVCLDNSHMSIVQTVNQVLKLADERNLRNHSL